MRPENRFLVRFAVVAVSLSIVLDASRPQLANPVPAIKQDLMQADAKVVARELLTEQQFRCFTQLMGKESAWNPKAKNPESSAVGVGQLLDSTYRNLGMKHSTEAVPQVVAALAYIGRKYGSAGPCGAWRHWKIKKWY